MKKIKYLFALVFAVCLLSTVAFADGLVVSDPVYDGTNVTIEFMYEGEVNEPISFSGIIKPANLNAFDGPSTTADFSTCKWNAGPKRVNLSITGGEANKKYTITMVPTGNPVGETLNFSSWIVNTTAANTSLVPSSTFTKTVTSAGPVSEDIEATVAAEYTTVKGATEDYTGVWVGTATKALGGKTMTAAKLVFGDNVKVITLPVKAADGDGSVAFKVAVLGVPRVEGTMTPAHAAKVVLTVE